MASGPNDDCPCGSTRKYKNCHYPIDSAVGAEKYAASQRVYVRNWRGTAELHYSQGIYHWLAQQVLPWSPKKILDVGCGSGHGLLAMLEVFGSDVVIIALDENRSCLETARETLRQKAKVNVPIVKRMSVEATVEGYRHVAEDFAMPEGPIVLVESDVCNDPFLISGLKTRAPFDLVTNWLTGVHILRQVNAAVRSRGISSDGEHRLYVQNTTYELADAVLASGGVLQIADRGEAPSSDLLREDILQAHGAQAKPTTLKVEEIAHTPYQPGPSRRTPMRLTPGILGLVPSDPTLAVISVVSVKP